MLGPGAAVVAATGGIAGGDLHAVVPCGGAFDGQTVADVHADVALHPHHLADLDAREVGGDLARAVDHGALGDVGHAVRLVGRAAVDMAEVTVPAPKQTLDEADAVKAEGVLRCGVDDGLSLRLAVVGGVLQVAGLVCVGHGGAEAAVDIQRLVVERHIQALGGQLGTRADGIGGELNGHRGLGPHLALGRADHQPIVTDGQDAVVESDLRVLAVLPGQVGHGNGLTRRNGVLAGEGGVVDGLLHGHVEVGREEGHGVTGIAGRRERDGLVYLVDRLVGADGGGHRFRLGLGDGFGDGFRFGHGLGLTFCFGFRKSVGLGRAGGHGRLGLGLRGCGLGRRAGISAAGKEAQGGQHQEAEEEDGLFHGRILRSERFCTPIILHFFAKCKRQKTDLPCFLPKLSQYGPKSSSRPLAPPARLCYHVHKPPRQTRTFTMKGKRHEKENHSTDIICDRCLDAGDAADGACVLREEGESL